MDGPLLVDSHCHLDRLDLTAWPNEGLDGALREAAEAGVGHMLCVCIDLENFSSVHALAQRHANVYASVGVHPNHNEGEEPTVERLLELADDPQVIAIGETGLDYFRTQHCDSDWQRERFARHIAAARACGKPLIIHMRDATDDTLGMLQSEGAREVGGIMHCFAEDQETARRALDLGFHISFSGIVTFASAESLREAARYVPADRLLVETDAPYLAPMPHRGKPNQPAWTRFVAEKIAEVRGERYAEIAQTTTDNFFRLFGTAIR